MEYGNTTEFTGQFTLDRPLEKAHRLYLERFSCSRRMKRDERLVENMEDPFRKAVGLPVGKEGEYFVGGEGEYGQNDDISVVDCNTAPSTQPGVWCQWIPDNNGESIVWDNGEKFYNYIEWIRYIITNFITPWGYVLNGEVEWQGERGSNFGKIVISHNVVKTLYGVKTYKE